MTRLKLLNVGLLLSSLLVYLQWDRQGVFLAEVEWDIFSQPSIQSFFHPIIMLPILAQLLLLITLFQRTPSPWLNWPGIIVLSILILFIHIVGLLIANFKIMLSTLPFLILAVYAGKQLLRLRKTTT